MIKLTCVDTGKTIYLNPKCINAIVHLEPFKSEFNGKEYPERTRIDYEGQGNCVLVKESVKEVYNLISKEN